MFYYMASNCSIIVVGDIMLDVNYMGTSTRLAQEACIPVVNVNESNITHALGGASNVYNNLLNMGLNAKLISITGNDHFSNAITMELNKRIISYKEKYQNCPTINIIKSSDRCTTVKHRFYVNNKIVFRYDTENTHDISETLETEIIACFKRACSHCTYVVISDYNKGLMTPRVVKEIIEHSNKNNIKVFVDPKTKDIQKYSNCFLIKPNKSEGEQICQHEISMSNLHDSVKQICERTNSENCLLTLGEDGMVLRSTGLSIIGSPPESVLYQNDKYTHIKTPSLNVIDITGAGDVVIAGMVYYYSKTHNLELSADFANYCGQLKVRNFGTYTITPYDILRYNKHNKLIPANEISTTIKIIKDANKKIVFTNGCYDILHYGHLTFLEEAKTLGDILIVALNSDASVKANKGDARPINKLEYRIKQLSAIGCIDFIIVFDEPTPYNLLECIRPNTLVKGGDYIATEVIGKEFADNTTILKYHSGISTTHIINEISNGDK